MLKLKKDDLILLTRLFINGIIMSVFVENKMHETVVRKGNARYDKEA